MMKTSEAVAMLERMQNPEPYEPQITEKAYKALEMAICALRWIPVSERLPEHGALVLATGQRGGIYIASIRATGEWKTFVRNLHIYPKAWMPIPEPYKDGER